MDDLERDYYEKLRGKPHFGGLLFNNMTEDEFMGYLHNRYPWWKFDERVQITYLVKPKLKEYV